MERKKDKTTIRNRSEANVSKVHLPEVRPENSSYKIAGKKKLAAASFEQKKEENRKAAYAQSQNEERNAFRDPSVQHTSETREHFSDDRKNVQVENTVGSAAKRTAYMQREAGKKTDLQNTAQRHIPFNDSAQNTSGASDNSDMSHRRAERAASMLDSMKAAAQLSEREHFSDTADKENADDLHSNSNSVNQRRNYAAAEYSKTAADYKKGGRELKTGEKDIKTADKEIDKTEKLLRADRAGTFDKFLSSARTASEVYGAVSAAADRNSVGEAARETAAVPVKIIGEKLLEQGIKGLTGNEVKKDPSTANKLSERKKSAPDISKENLSSPDEEFIGGLVTGAAASGNGKADNTGKAAAKEFVSKTVTDTADSLYRKQIEKKRERLKAQRDRSEKRAENIRREHIARDMKVNVYKSAHGITSATATASQNAKAIFKAADEIIGSPSLPKKSAGVITAALCGVLVPLMGVVIILMSVISQFSWLVPHSEEQYNEAANSWETLSFTENDEILKGYITHIRDYFDKRQLEILEIVDLNFDGFEPDKYDYDQNEDKNGVLSFEGRPKYECEKTGYSVKRQVRGMVMKLIPNPHGGPPSTHPTEVTLENTEPYTVIYSVMYFKDDPALGYERRCNSTESEYTRAYAEISIDLNALCSEYTFENGSVRAGEDITDIDMKQFDSDGKVVYSGKFLDYINGNANIFKDFAPVDTSEMYSVISDISAWQTDSVKEEQEDIQYEFENYIWNLNEYGNRWIKLSDDCDFEHIIALAAVKKWQEIEESGFDSESYDFTITDEDLDYCLDRLYDFSYGYTTGECRHRNCHQYIANGAVCYKCNRSTTHKHLIGGVSNYELSGGLGYILNRVLKMPIVSDYGNTEEYNAAMAQFETDKEIYEVYCGYISDTLGTSTKLPDYENDEEAQYRLLRMHQAKSGKKPSNPPQNVSAAYRIDTSYEVRMSAPESMWSVRHEMEVYTEHLMLNISWTAPEPEEYTKGKFVNISGYNVYSYNPKNGLKKLIATTSDTSCEAEYQKGYEAEKETGTMEYDTGTAAGTVTIGITTSIKYKLGSSAPYDIIIYVTAYNEAGESPKSDKFRLKVKAADET